jgi:hypothetical protein
MNFAGNGEIASHMGGIKYLEVFMKKVLLFFSIFVLFGLVSCVTVQDRMLPPQERESAEIIGRVNTKFTTFQPFHVVLKDTVSKKAYSMLMAEARKQYQGNIEVVNITADGTFNPLTLLPGFPHLGFFGNFQTISVSGDVVQYSEGISSTGITQNLTNAVTNLSKEVAEKLPRDSTIAVLSVFSKNRNTSEYIIGEIEYNLVNSGKFKIVDRRRLDQIRTEQNFQLSGDVNDDSAVSIGNMLGANIVITGEITGTGSNQRLVLKALDVKTAQIITMAREQF